MDAKVAVKIGEFEGVGVKDEDDGNSSLKKRIDRDEALLIALNSNTEFATATSAVISLDRIQQINGGSHGGIIKLVALFEYSIVKEEVFTLVNINIKDKITFRSVNFRTISNWVEENNL